MSRSSYREIGGRETVKQVVDDFYDRVLSDDRLAGFFEGMDMAELRAHQVQFISAVAGGPVEYAGTDMREAHAHLDLGEDDFDRVVTHLETALRETGVDDDHVEVILGEVVGLKDPILAR